MALTEEKNRRMAMAIIRVVHECDAGMRVGVTYYRTALARGDTVEATNLLKRAARLPYRVESRVQALVSKYGAAAINAALALVSSHTLTTLQAELAPLKTYSDTLRTNYQSGATLDDIAADIETNAAQVDQDEAAPIPGDYVDDM